MQDVGELVYWHRDQRGWTQENLASNAGLSATTISNIESGAIERPRMNTVRRLARAFGVSTEEFLQGDVTPSPKEQAPTSPGPSEEERIAELHNARDIINTLIKRWGEETQQNLAQGS